MQSLSNIRVLDLSRLLPGPFATMVLSDLGATVDKLEDPMQGDYLRHMPPQRGGANVAFETLNRSKRSLVLDLKSPEGRDAFLRLVGHYDVLFEQFRGDWAADDDLAAAAKANTFENFMIPFAKKFMEVVLGRMDANAEIFQAILDDPGFADDLKSSYGRDLYSQLNDD